MRICRASSSSGGIADGPTLIRKAVGADVTSTWQGYQARNDCAPYSTCHGSAISPASTQASRLPRLGIPEIQDSHLRAWLLLASTRWVPKSNDAKVQHPVLGIKFLRNVSRDQSSTAQLRNLGWVIGVIWECEAKDPKGVEDRLRALLCLEGNEAA